MRRQAGFTVMLVFAISLGLFFPSTAISGEGNVFQTSTKSHLVKNWKQSSIPIQPNCDYWLIAKASPLKGGVPIKEMAGVSGFEVQDVSPREGFVAYKVRISKTGVRLKPLLKYDEFITLLPFDDYDKIDLSVIGEYDRRSRLKWSNSAIAVDDPLKELIMLRVRLAQNNNDDAGADSVCSQMGMSACSRDVGSDEIVGLLPANGVFELSKMTNVRNISLDIETKELNSSSRNLTGVTQLQSHLNWTSFECGISRVEPCWNENQDATGEGIWIGISEGDPLSSEHPDFQESGKIRTPSLPSDYVKYLNWSHSTAGGEPGTHIAHVAGIAAGNGQSSQSYGGQSFQWRGVAPKALIIPMTASTMPIGDVNNYSIVGSPTYSAGTGYTDDGPTRHQSDVLEHGNVCVWAAGNNGVYNASTGSSYAKSVGFFSMLNVPKNCIMVGNVDKVTGIKNENSSMGPTRDGRIGPDIMAPGGTRSVEASKPIFTIDQVEIINSSGVKVVNGQSLEWSFNTTDEGWSLASGNGLLTVSGGALRASSSGGPIILRVPLPSVKIDPGDKVRVKYKLDYADIAGISDEEPVYLRVSGFDKTNTVIERNKQDYLSVEMDLSNKSQCRGFSCQSSPTLAQLDLSVGELESVVSVFPGGGYFQDDGTSMSAPHVAGVVALMLQSYDRKKRAHFQALGTDIHRSPMWSSTIKAILIHTADDMIALTGSKHKRPNRDIVANTPGSGSLLPEQLTEVYGPGPDWATGYGLINAQNAVGYSKAMDFLQGSIGGGETREILVTIPSGVQKFRVTIAWDDPGVKTPSGPNSQTLTQASTLVNDLDLELVSPSGVSNYPWVLDPAPFFPSSVTADGIDVNSNFTQANILAKSAKKIPLGDHRNNVEVVDLDNPAAGTWRIRIKGYNLLQGPQDYSVVAKGINATDPSTGIVLRDPSGVIFAQTTLKLQTKGCGWGATSASSVSFKYSGSEKLSVSRTYGLSKSSSVVNPTWLSNEANLKGGLVLRDPSDKAVFHLSPNGLITVPTTGACNSNL